MKFLLQTKDTNSSARAGIIKTAHGEIPTPIFMPVGTAATVKGVHQRELSKDIGAPIILSNTYHLYLRPGIDIISQAGGIHKFAGWEGSILTDSGGYQIFSLAHQCKIKEEGATFHSHIDGSTHLFTPENVMDIQRTIGADIIMAFDECTHYPCDENHARTSMDRTHRWLKRCVNRFRETEPKYGYEQNLFPIVQGSIFRNLRKESAEIIAGCELEGNAIGGLSVGEPPEMMYEMTELVCDILPANKPRYLMGVGTPANILESIALGIDMFDCVMPTRNARHGILYTSEGIINIKNEKWKTDFSSIDSEGTVFADHQYSKAYLRHLFSVGELLGGQIASLHNLGFYLNLVKTAREKIVDGSFNSWKVEMVEKLGRRI